MTLDSYKQILVELIKELDEVVDYYNRSTYDMVPDVVQDIKNTLAKYRNEL